MTKKHQIFFLNKKNKIELYNDAYYDSYAQAELYIINHLSGEVFLILEVLVH